MDDSSGPRWLSYYYARTQSDCEISFRRRDNVTHWSYVIMAAMVGTYAGFFAGDSGVPPLGRLGLVAGATIVLTRFFFMSAIAYGFYRRSRYLRERIEQHWMRGAPTLEQIVSDIARYDHGRSAPPVVRRLLVGQVKSGAVIALVVPSILLLHEMSLHQGWEHCLVLVCLIAYAGLEGFNYARYGQIHPPSGKGG